jgi:pilus assembly protein TadC
MEWQVVAAIAVGAAVLSWWPPVAARLRVRTPLTRAGEAVRRQRRRRLGAATATGAAVAFAFGSLGWWAWPIGAAATAASYVILGQLVSGEVAKRQARLTAELPQVCDLLVVCLEAGLPLRVGAQAVAEALTGPMAEELSEVSAKVRLGIDEQRAWAEFGAQPALAKLGRELSRGASSGMSLTTRLRALGVDARRAAEGQAETAAKKVGVRSVMPLMVCFLPAFVVVGVVPIVGGMVSRLFG